MERVPVAERADWKQTAAEHGFEFHTIGGDAYWDESAYYRFTLKQIEDDLEDPSEEVEQMCFAVIDRAVDDEELMARLRIPEAFRDYVAESWRHKDKNLYGRMDFSYDGKGPAKLLEYNADTPTSLYESAIFQWVWLEQALERGLIPQGCDQFNALHEALVGTLSRFGIRGCLHLAGALASSEDRGTVAYVEDCARQARIETAMVDMADIGIDAQGRFTDRDDRLIATLFKLYPWEWLMAEDFGRHIPASGTQFIEPAWKAILSNKGLLAVLWEMFEGHRTCCPPISRTTRRPPVWAIPSSASRCFPAKARMWRWSGTAGTRWPGKGRMARKAMSFRRSIRCRILTATTRCLVAGWSRAGRRGWACARTRA